MLRKLVVYLVGLACLLAVALVLMTWQRGTRQMQVAPVKPVAVDANADEFRKLHALLASQFPAAHAAMKREVIGEFSLLYTWTGRDPALPAVRAGPEELARFHGTNERMSIANYTQIIQFYHRLISNLEALR